MRNAEFGMREFFPHSGFSIPDFREVHLPLGGEGRRKEAS
jgi:hypothetical protein